MKKLINAAVSISLFTLALAIATFCMYVLITDARQLQTDEQALKTFIASF